MKYFLLFIGYPKSGNTLVANILNSNPNVICSSQLNIFADDNIDFNLIKSYNNSTWKNITQIKHVTKQEIKVIGDETGHKTVELLKSNPQKLGIVKSKINVPIKWIHMVRNPFDNLSTWAKFNYENKLKNGQESYKTYELDNVINKYIDLNNTISKIKLSENVLTIRHEYVITRMHNTLEEMCNFLEISFDPDWRDNVRNAVWKKPIITRREMPWNQKQKGIVHDLIAKYDWLSGYDYGCGRC